MEDRRMKREAKIIGNIKGEVGVFIRVPATISEARFGQIAQALSYYIEGILKAAEESRNPETLEKGTENLLCHISAASKEMLEAIREKH